MQDLFLAMWIAHYMLGELLITCKLISAPSAEEDREFYDIFQSSLFNVPTLRGRPYLLHSIE